MKKQTGFTLIELLVVIVIIGILATISVATFSDYFSKARDSERQANASQAAKLLKTAKASEVITGYDALSLGGMGPFLDPELVISKLKEMDQNQLPETKQGFKYYYFSSDADNFALYTCSEDEDELIVFGTSADISTVEGADGATCSSAGVQNGMALMEAVDITFSNIPPAGTWVLTTRSNCPTPTVLGTCNYFGGSCNGASEGAGCFNLGQTGQCTTLCSMSTGGWCDDLLTCQ